ncbi:SDR family NAD(P)-dependent oxidoreductase [Dactylosporangium siamense]|uniref:Oxidoreductase n=1 Tax=Dactylosporangium siamense TaxID=685454 RepID=A0A919U7W4_9ACTN|nr:SDR family NAD(P)-dependent oxidoreductase [Dactylosporangium siamense]GIG45924.1 oxidoreductase [Dactylosporangium siamense]
MTHPTADDVLRGVDLTGRTAIVTGGTSGIGLETCRALARAGARVVAGARSASLVDGLEVRRLDLADLEQVREFAAGFDAVDILIANAGIMACPLTRVGPGWEAQLAVNHLGHFALVHHLWPALLRGRDARVVVVSSSAAPDAPIRWDDPHFTTGYDKWQAYAQSKAANALFAAQLDEFGRSAGVRASSTHPGAILTPLQRHLTRAEMLAAGWIDEAGRAAAYFKTPAQGAATQVWAATSITAAGRHCDDCAVTPFRPDPADASRLWALSAALTGLAPTLAGR